MIKKKCGRCNSILYIDCFNKDKYTKSGYRSQCKKCMKLEREFLKDYYKEWRETPSIKEKYSQYRKFHYDLQKTKARNATRKLEKMPCCMCGTTEKIHAHHDDYMKPLDVMWLCVTHHIARHAFLNYLGQDIL